MSLLSTLGLWGLTCLILLGLGRIVQGALRPRLDNSQADWITALWLGWAGLLAGLQLWHLFRPVDGLAWAVSAALACAGLAFRSSRTWFHTRLSWAAMPPALLLLTAAAVLALRSRGCVENYDTGLYHLDSVRWAEQFAAIPGLGNLHGRLAFNCSHFLYGAWADRAPLGTGLGHHFSQGPLILLLLATGLRAAVRLLQAAAPQRLSDLFFTLSLVPGLELLLGSNVTGYSPDLAVFILGIGVAGTTLQLFEMPRSEPLTAYLTVIILCLAGLTVKINFILFGAPLLLIASLRVITASDCARSTRRAMLAAILSVGLVWLVPWVVRGIITSGYPAYPLTLGGLPVSWRVPTPIALTEAMVVSTWAREPGFFWANIGGIADWFPGWLQRLPGEFRQQALIAITLFFVWVLGCSAPDPTLRRRWQIAFVTASIVGLLGWFALAPDIRFSGASLSCLTLFCGVFLLGRLAPATDLHPQFGAVVTTGLLLWAGLRGVPAQFQQAVENARTDLVALPAPGVVDRITESGLVVHLPVEGIQTWGMALPATHLFRSDLELRVPGRPDRGFRVTRPLEHMDGVGQRAAPDLRVPDGYAGRFLDGWGHPEAEGTRWMQTPGRLLLFAPRSGPLQLHLKTGWIDMGGQPATEGTLACYVGDRLIGAFPLRRGETTSMTLPLRYGFNLVAFTAEETPPSRLDFRRIKDQGGAANIAFQSVQFSAAKSTSLSR